MMLRQNKQLQVGAVDKRLSSRDMQMTHIIGSIHDVAMYGNLRAWAENGLVRIEDARDNSYEVITVKEAKARIKAQADILSSDYYDSDGKSKLTSFIDQMLTVIMKAKEQGMPSDPGASKDLKRRRAKSVVVPSDILGIN